jgi:hypothetical protein
MSDPGDGVECINILSDSDASLPLTVVPIPKYYTYECSPKEVPFSFFHLNSLTIRQCIDIVIPAILPDNHVQLVGWSRVEPVAGGHFLLNGCIPSLNDIRVFLGDMCKEFGRGNRCVVVEAQGKVAHNGNFLDLIAYLQHR